MKNQFAVFGFLISTLLASAPPGVFAQTATGGSYKVLRTAKVGGDGGFDYVYADSVGRKLYIARSGPTARSSVTCSLVTKGAPRMAVATGN